MRDLLEEDSRLAWDAEAVMASAETLELDSQDGLYTAETARHEACQEVTAAVRERIAAGELSFGARLESDVSELVTLLFPVPSVERCAEAQTAYKREIGALCLRLEPRDGSLTCPN